MLEAALIAGARIAKTLLRLNPDQFADRVKIDNALEGLRRIFFFPSDLTSALEMIAEGQAIDPEIAHHFAEQYAGVPHHIEDAFSILDAERFNSSNALLLGDLETMHQVQIGKISARREVNRLFSDYIRRSRNSTDMFEPSERAARLIAQIDRLNDLMKRLEKKLLAARQGKSGELRTRARRPTAR